MQIDIVMESDRKISSRGGSLKIGTLKTWNRCRYFESSSFLGSISVPASTRYRKARVLAVVSGVPATDEQNPRQLFFLYQNHFTIPWSSHPPSPQASVCFPVQGNFLNQFGYSISDSADLGSVWSDRIFYCSKNLGVYLYYFMLLFRAIYTEVLQAVSILIGAGAILVLGTFKKRFVHIGLLTNSLHIFFPAFIRVGGYKNLVQQYPDAKPNGSYAMPNTSCSVPLDDAFVMLREPTDPNLPWPGFLLGQTTVSIWYWAADQVGKRTFISA